MAMYAIVAVGNACTLMNNVSCHQECHLVLPRIAIHYNEPWHEISNNVVHVYATSKGSDQPAHTRRLIRGFASRLNIL